MHLQSRGSILSTVSLKEDFDSVSEADSTSILEKSRVQGLGFRVELLGSCFDVKSRVDRVGCGDGNRVSRGYCANFRSVCWIRLHNRFS